MHAVSFTSTDLDPRQVVDALTGAGFEVAPARKVRRTVLDTFDGRLHARGLRLELRDERGGELVLSGDSEPAHAHAPGVPRLAGDLPEPLRTRLAPVLDVRALIPKVTVTATFTEATRRDRAGGARSTVSVYDEVHADGPGGLAPSWVAEVGRLAGSAKAAARTRRLLGTLGLEELEGGMVDVVSAAAGIDLRGYTSSPTVVLSPGEPALEAFRRVLTNLAAAIDAHWQGTADDIDPEFLHDLRVAVRRTRSVLAQGRRVVPDQVRDRSRQAFSWLGTATGPARDLDVYVIEWEDYVSPLGAEAAGALAPVLAHIRSRHRKEHAGLGKVLRSARYRSLMSGWRAWLDEPPEEGAGRDALRPIGRVAAHRIGRAQDQLVGRGRTIEQATPAEELHELRKDAKKLRYLLECFGGLYPAAPRKAFVQRLKALQDNLGSHQDAEVHADQLRAMARELHGRPGVGPATEVAMAQLTENLQRRRQSARDQFGERFTAYDTKQTRRSLKELIDSTEGRDASKIRR